MSTLFFDAHYFDDRCDSPRMRRLCGKVEPRGIATGTEIRTTAGPVCSERGCWDLGVRSESGRSERQQWGGCGPSGPAGQRPRRTVEKLTHHPRCTGTREPLFDWRASSRRRCPSASRPSHRRSRWRLRPPSRTDHGRSAAAQSAGNQQPDPAGRRPCSP